MDPEYVTGQINSHILELLLRRFFCLHRLQNPNKLQSDKAFSQRPQKIFQSFASVDTALSDSYDYLAMYESLKNSYLEKAFVP